MADFVVPANILPRYDNQAQLSQHNVVNMRGIMHHFNIPYRDGQGNILPAFRGQNGNFIRLRRPYIDAIINHFNVNPPDQVPHNQIPPAPRNVPNVNEHNLNMNES